MLAIDKELGNNVHSWWNLYIMGVIILPFKQSSFYALYGQECLIHFSISTPISKIEGVNEMIGIM